MQNGQRFVREKFIAEGGFGEMWKAKEIKNGKHVALKVLKT